MLSRQCAAAIVDDVEHVEPDALREYTLVVRPWSGASSSVSCRRLAIRLRTSGRSDPGANVTTATQVAQSFERSLQHLPTCYVDSDGSSSAQHLRDDLGCFDFEVDRDDVAAIERIASSG